MRPFMGITCAIALLATFGCSSQDGRVMQSDTGDVEEITELLASHVAAVNSGDIAANLAGFTEDVMYLPADGPPIHGKPALESFVRSFFEVSSVEINMVPEETVVVGDWAFQWGMVTGTVRPLDGSDSTSIDWKYMYLYERQPDGTWLIARDIYNSNVPPASGG